MNIKFLILLSLLVTLLLLIPSAFAVDGSNETVKNSVDDDVLGTNEYYFDSSVNVDGDGSKANPYKTLSDGRIKSDSICHFANGTYYLSDNSMVSDISFYGDDASKTIIDGNGYGLLALGLINFKNVTLSNFFIYNQWGSVSATNSIFCNSKGMSYDYGGSIYSDSGQITLTNCTFMNNYAEFGGAIFVEDSVLQITDSVFLNNTASNFGGAIAAKSSGLTITNSRFSNDKSINDAGGSIYLIYSNLTGDNINFTNSKAIFGASISALESDVDLNNILAMNNVASYAGGAIYSMYGSFKLKNSKFINNTAYNGGALSVDNVTEGNILSNYFINNTASHFGGAIHAFFNNLIIETNYYSGNHARNYSDMFKTDLLDMFIGNNNYTRYSGNLTYNGEIPSYYNLAELGFDTSVKNQMSGGNCWAFSAIAVLESCILKAGGSPLDLSEENMKNLMALFSDYGWRNKLPNDGGNFYMALGYLASWLGPIYDIQDVYNDESAVSPVYNSIMHVQNAIFLKRTSFSDNDEIKKAILKYGSVSTSMYYDDEYLYSGYKYCYKGSEESDHAVTIVGWDDTMIIAGYTGAWIVKNSWGPDWGNNGYFYVSYYDNTLLEIGEYDGFTFILNDTIPYDKNYQYDFGLMSRLSFKNVVKTVLYKNKFISTGEEYLAAVSTYFDKNYDWEYEIVVNGVSKCSQSGSSVAGYYTFKLPEFIKLHKDDVFEVIFKITSGDGVIIPVYKSEVVFGFDLPVSYYSTEGSSFTPIEDNVVACIKAFTFVNDIKTQTTLDLVYDGLFNITARVVDEYGNLLDKGVLTLTVDGVSSDYNIVNGIVSIKTSLNKESNSISAVFNAAGYQLSSNSTSFTRTSIAADNFSTIYGSGDSYSISLSDFYGASVANRAVKFIVSNGYTYTTSTDANGVAVLPVNLDAGKYDVTIQYAGYGSTGTDLSISKSFDISKKLVVLSINENINKNNATITVSSTESINSPAVINVDGEDKNYAFVNGNIIFKLSDLAYGSHTVKVKDVTNYEFSNNLLTFNINIKKSKITANNLVTFYGSNALFYITLLDDANNPLSSKEIIFSVNGNTYTNTTDASGSTAIPINLPIGNFDITAKFTGNDDYFDSSFKSNVLIKSTIIIQSSTYRSNDNYTAFFLNSNGEALANGKVKINLNNKDNEIICDKDGKAVLNLDVGDGDYTVMLKNIETGESLSHTIKVSNPKNESENETGDDHSSGEVQPTEITYQIVQNSDLIMYYGDSKDYQVRVCNNKGEFVGGVKVTFVFRGVEYIVPTDSMGYASIRLSLNSGTHTITAKIDGFEVSNKIIVKPTLTAKNINVKKGKPIKFTAKLVDINGKALKKKKITFKFKGKKYKVKTNKNGVATLKVTKKLKSGKYPIYTSYGKMKIKNTIKIR